MFNAYLFITGGEHHIKLAQDVNHADAMAACRAELLYLPRLWILGDSWVDAGHAPRLAVFAAKTDPILMRERGEI